MIAQEGRMTSRERAASTKIYRRSWVAHSSYCGMLRFDQAIVVLDLRVQMHFIASVNHRDRYVESVEVSRDLFCFCVRDQFLDFLFE